LWHALTECSSDGNVPDYSEIVQGPEEIVEQLIKEQLGSEEKTSEDNQRRQQILDTARRLFSNRGYHGVSIRTIASEAGLKSPAHVYFYFENKADLYREALAQITAPMREISVSGSALDRPPERALASIARAYLRMFDDEETVQLYRMALMEAATNPEFGADDLEAGGGQQGLQVVEAERERGVCCLRGAAGCKFRLIQHLPARSHILRHRDSHSDRNDT